jgi:hypothetical protein
MKLLPTIALILATTAAHALGGNPNVRFSPVKGAFRLIDGGMPAVIRVDETEWPGVKRAVNDLSKDLTMVGGPISGSNDGTRRILVGTLGKSPTIDTLVRQGKLDVKAIKGKWEASVTQVVGDTLVVAGSDKRGTIYALYDLSEAAGVSPWFWWADVPIKRHKDVFVTGRHVAKEPVVKYRGIFLNDEEPGLGGWAREKFGGLNSKMYAHVFELLLRLKANYLWPAMWGKAFCQDDKENPRLADEYGIVMGTSHVEPMMRADVEWNRLGLGEREWNYDTHPKELEMFWTDGILRSRPYENVVTIAMRGKVDTPMSETANISLLERIVAKQREILAQHVNPDVTQIPQLWCLYKEVQEYYEKGMRVPDDVTLLWSDDNWGNIRRLPTPDERKRKGGAGVYYHFDYVGGPRNYKWLDTNPIPKIWEQMNLAYRYDANRIWIVNVGDLKPMEFPMEFFLTMARDPAAIKKEELQKYTERWAAREFGEAHAREIAQIVSETKRLNGRRKPELIDANTFSVENYGEADRVVGEYQALLARAERIEKLLPTEAHSAYYQLVLHPIKAPTNLVEMYVAAAKNALYAKRNDPRANAEAQRVRDLFAKDKAISAEYHALNGGKWNHQMDQTHIGYTSWQQPDVDVMPRVIEIQVAKGAELGIAKEGSSEAWPGSRGVPSFDFFPKGPSSQWFEVFNRGAEPLEYEIRETRGDAPWLSLSKWKGVVRDGERIEVSVDWSRVSNRGGRAVLSVRAASGYSHAVAVYAIPRSRPEVGAHPGFLETDGVIAIEAEHTSRRIAAKSVKWETIPGYGRTLSAVEPFPVEFRPFQSGKGARLEYDLTVVTGGKATLEALVAPTLAFQPGRGVRVAFAFDNDKPQVVDVAPAYLSRAWEIAVSDAVHKVRTQHDLKPGKHVLKIWAIDPGVVIERLHLHLGGLKPSYLGPPESRRF